MQQVAVILSPIYKAVQFTYNSFLELVSFELW